MEWSRPRARSVEGWAALILAAFFCQNALAQPRKEEIALSWQRSAGAEDCPDESAFVAAVARRTKTPLAADAPRRLDVVVTRTADAWHAGLTYSDSSGRASTSELSTTGDDCTTIFSAAAVAASVAIAVVERTAVSSSTFEDGELRAVQIQAIVREPPFENALLERATSADRGASHQRGPHRSSDFGNRFGLEMAQDVSFMGSASSLCDGSAGAQCFDGDRPVVTVNRSAAGAVDEGLVVATRRVLASFEVTVSGPWSAMVRAGYAFGSTAPTPEGGRDYLPVHFETDLRYRFGGPTVRGALFAGAGIAQVDSRVDVDVVECPGFTCDSLNPDFGTRRTVAAYRSDGLAFATAGADVLWAFESDFGAFFRMGALALFPARGFVLQPSIGVSAGF